MSVGDLKKIYHTHRSPGERFDCQFSFSRSRIGLGEGDGTPLQYSCLENPMDGGLQSMGSRRVERKLVAEQQLSVCIRIISTVTYESLRAKYQTCCYPSAIKLSLET